MHLQWNKKSYVREVHSDPQNNQLQLICGMQNSRCNKFLQNFIAVFNCNTNDQLKKLPTKLKRILFHDSSNELSLWDKLAQRKSKKIQNGWLVVFCLEYMLFRKNYKQQCTISFSKTPVSSCLQKSSFWILTSGLQRGPSVAKVLRSSFNILTTYKIVHCCITKAFHLWSLSFSINETFWVFTAFNFFILFYDVSYMLLLVFRCQY